MGDKSKKHGRNKIECKNYQVSGRAEINQAKKLHRHLREFQDDQSARDSLGSLSQSAQKAAERELKAAGFKFK